MLLFIVAFCAQTSDRPLMHDAGAGLWTWMTYTACTMDSSHESRAQFFEVLKITPERSIFK